MDKILTRKNNNKLFLIQCKIQILVLLLEFSNSKVVLVTILSKVRIKISHKQKVRSKNSKILTLIQNMKMNFNNKICPLCLKINYMSEAKGIVNSNMKKNKFRI